MGNTLTKQKKCRTRTLPPRREEVNAADCRVRAPLQNAQTLTPVGTNFELAGGVYLPQSQEPPPPDDRTYNSSMGSNAATLDGPSQATAGATSKNNYKLVVAIDFGTTYSGYCYAYITGDTKPEVHINKNWGGVAAAALYKTPTSVCVKDGNFHSIGFEAETCYTQQEVTDDADDDDDDDDDDEASAGNTDLKLYQHFKMELYKEENIDRDLEIVSRDGKKIKAMDVFSMAIKYFKDHCCEVIRSAGRLPTWENILWVLTVPAIWGDQQKMFMREAAIKAGLILSIEDKRLLIALEPESASIYCRSLAVEQLSKAASGGPNTLPMGSCYMIVDAGGGTIDITCYRCLPNGAAEEIHQASGGNWGGNRVNREFEQLLAKILGLDFMRKCKREYAYALFQLMNSFEQAKCQFNPDSDSPVLISISMAFGDRFRDFSKKKLKQHFQDNPYEGVKVSAHGSLQLSSAVMKSLFDSVIDNILHHLRGLSTLPKLKNVQNIFLVGGFGQCQYLKQRLKNAFQYTKITTIVPENPVLCVLEGAVIYGCNPDLIKSRVSARTYSFAAYRSNDEKYLVKVIEKGDSVQNGEVRNHFAEPTFSGTSTSVTMELYASDDFFSESLEDPNNYRVGEITVQCPIKDSSKGLVEFTFIFGGTEIKVEGESKKSKDKNSTTINFLGSRMDRGINSRSW